MSLINTLNIKLNLLTKRNKIINDRIILIKSVLIFLIYVNKNYKKNQILKKKF